MFKIFFILLIKDIFIFLVENYFYIKYTNFILSFISYLIV